MIDRAESPTSFDQLALERLGRILGTPAGRRTFDGVLAEIGLASLATPDDLYTFAKALSGRGGFEGTVGGFLGVTAVLRGATRRP